MMLGFGRCWIAVQTIGSGGMVQSGGLKIVFFPLKFLEPLDPHKGKSASLGGEGDDQSSHRPATMRR
jgi:hypothetical protein